jgi:uncharacterized protein (UPF0335 family)
MMKKEHEYHMINRIENENACLWQDLFSVFKEESGDW